MNQALFKNRDSYVNWRRQLKNTYLEVSATIRTLKATSRDMNLTEAERQSAGKHMNTAKCSARTMMIGLDYVKMMYALTHKELPPKRIKNIPTAEQIEERRVAKFGGGDAVAIHEIKQTITN